jgi:hypothetical protein
MSVAIRADLLCAFLTSAQQPFERVVAPEWTSVQSDGSVLTRDVMLKNCLCGAITMEGRTIDDVRVDVFGGTAVVRGRTVATALVNGTRTTPRLRFVDGF